MKYEDKQIIMDTIKSNVSIFRKRSPIRWSIRCPLCGDSKKDPTDSHCYIKFSMDDSEPLLYNCFLCNEHGAVNKRFLDAIGIKDDLSEVIGRQKYNHVKSIKNNPVEIITGSPIPDSLQIRYIEYRIGKGLTLEDYDRFKIVWDIDALIPFISDDKVKNTLPSNRESISFLSDDKSLLLTRMFEDNGNDGFSDDEIRWKKTRLMRSYDGSYYTIKTTMDLFTKDDIVVNIAEGVMDILSIYKNFNDGPNSIYIGALGSNYVSALKYAIDKGFIGSNVSIKVYMDNGINMKQLIGSLKPYKWLFKSISIYRNIIGKDVGVKVEKIRLEERRV